MIDNKVPLEIPKKDKKKRVRGDAITRLAKASARTVRDSSDLIADSMLNGALTGNMNCAKMLVALIEKLPPRKKRKQRSMALELMQFPEWTGTSPEKQRDPQQDDIDWENSLLEEKQLRAEEIDRLVAKFSAND